MTYANYGVAVTVIHRGRVKQNMLVFGPKVDFRHAVYSGDQDFAEQLCTKMRKAQAKAPIPNGENIYTVVPLPVIGDLPCGG
jgi:hypothetical protein